MSLISNLVRTSGEDTTFVTARGKDIFGLRKHEVGCLAKYSTWTDITNKLVNFNVKRAGFLFIPYAEITLENEDGYFTKGTYDIGYNRQMIIKAKYNDTWFQLIHGRVHKFYETPILGTYPKETEITYLARSHCGQKLLDERITEAYFDKGKTCLTAIEDLLENPDSGVDTGLRLVTDEGIIHTAVAPENFERENLVSAIKIIADEIGYDGYIVDEANLIILRALATEPAEPPVSYHSELLRLAPEFNQDEVHNHILPWGSTDQGYPVTDIWCEWGLARYSPPAWDKGNPLSVVSDDTEFFDIGETSIRATRTTSVGYVKMLLDLAKAGYVRPQDGAPRLDLDDNRFTQIWYKFRFLPSPGDRLQEVLIDNADKEAWRMSDKFSDGTWEATSTSVLVDDHGIWTEDSGFNWAEIAKIKLSSWNTWGPDVYFSVDGLRFTGAGWDINPITKSAYCPAHTDSTSITKYSRKVHHLIKYRDDIHNFEQAYLIAELYLNVHKNPLQRIKIASGFKPWLKPHNVVKLGMPEWAIFNEDWRLMSLEHDWNSDKKIVYTSVEILPAAWSLQTVAALRTRLGGFLKTVT